MRNHQEDYSDLHKVSREIRILDGIHSLLDWDQETYMPSGAAPIRAEQFKTLAEIIHKKKTSGPFLKTLSKLVDLKTGKMIAKGLSAAQTAALSEWHRDYKKEKVLPKSFVSNWAQLTSQGVHAWRHAKEQDAFNQFSPYLEKIVGLARKKAEYLGYKSHPYDALLDLYEPGTTYKDLSILFKHLRTELTALLKKIKAQKPVDDSFLFGTFPKEQQLEFGHALLTALGYSSDHGRLDLSSHPFSSAAHPSDSRITTRIHPNSLMSNISAVMHEAGHALYEMGLPQEQYGTPLGDAISLGMHESQSRWWETRIGHSKPFWKHFLPVLKQHFKTLDDIKLDTFYHALNKVKPGLIRIEADEVTYCLHVILRFELEYALIDGSLKVRDLPEAWNAKMKELLGVVPSNNREGCLQDIHWSMGAIGYFPTYALGNLYAAQLFAAFTKEHADWESRVAKGELLFIKDWLSKAVYQHGRRYSSQELIQLVTKKPISANDYIDYLNNKYR